MEVRTSEWLDHIEQDIRCVWNALKGAHAPAVVLSRFTGLLERVASMRDHIAKWGFRRGITRRKGRRDE